MPSKFTSSSYELFYDNNTNLNEYYFTYYHVVNSSNRSNVTLLSEIIILAAICIVSLIVNIYVALTITCQTHSKIINNYLVLNMVIADIVFVLTIPGVIYVRIVSNWNIGNVLCRTIPYLQFVSATVLLWTLTLISIDRNRSLGLPSCRNKITSVHALLLSSITWIVILITYAPVTIWFTVESSLNGNLVCTIIPSRSNLIRYTIVVLLPIIVIVYLALITIQIYKYCTIFRKILSTRSTWASSCVFVSTIDTRGCSRSELRRQSEISISEILTPWSRRFSNTLQIGNNGGGVGGGSSSGAGGYQTTRHGSMSQQEENRYNKRVKVIRTLSINIVLLLIMWLPITLMPLLILCDGLMIRNENESHFLNSTHLLIALILAYLNTIANPTLFSIYSDSFQLSNLIKLCNCKKTNKNVITLRNNLTDSTTKHVNNAVDIKEM